MTFHIDRLNAIGNHINEWIEAGDLLGAQARVYQNGELVYETVRGRATIENACPLTPRSIYRMASMTKPVVAAAVLLAEQEGLLSISDSVSRYIPEYAGLRCAVRAENGAILPGEPVDIKLHHLLTHTSGILGGFPTKHGDVTYPSVGEEQLAGMTPADQQTVSTAVRFYSGTLTGFMPGSAAAYSGVPTFDICAEILSRVCGMPFEEYIAHRIIEPLEMADTGFVLKDRRRLVSLTTKRENVCVEIDQGDSIFRKFPPTYHCGGAGLLSTVVDYARFMLMLQFDGCYQGNRILPRGIVQKMSIPYVPPFTMGVPRCYSWGYGVRVTRNDPVLPDGCFGWSGAYGTHFFIDPTHHVSAIFMKNTEYDGGSEARTGKVFEQDIMNALISD